MAFIANVINSLKFRVGCAISCAGVSFRTWCFLYCRPLYNIVR